MEDKLKQELIVQWLRQGTESIREFKDLMEKEMSLSKETLDQFINEVGPARLLQLGRRYNAIAYRLAKETMK